MNTNYDSEIWLRADYSPVAVYFADSDCVEYVAEETTCVYERVDEFLTLIYDETVMIPIGFKLKGFRNCFEKLKEEIGFADDHFLELVKVVEAVCTTLGNAKFAEDAKRRRAYEAARKLARDVKLYDLPLAA